MHGRLAILDLPALSLSTSWNSMNSSFDDEHEDRDKWKSFSVSLSIRKFTDKGSEILFVKLHHRPMWAIKNVLRNHSFIFRLTHSLVATKELLEEEKQNFFLHSRVALRKGTAWRSRRERKYYAFDYTELETPSASTWTNVGRSLKRARNQLNYESTKATAGSQFNSLDWQV